MAITAQGAGWDGALEVAPQGAAETYTQSYLASLLTLFRLAAGARRVGSRRASWRRLPDRVAGALADPQPDAVLLPARLLVLVGAGPCAVTAAEGALKLREGARLPAEGYSAELLLHGSAVPLDERDALVLVGSELDPHGIVALVGEAARREGIAVHRLATREGLDPLLSQLPLTVLVQRLALRLAQERGCDADTVITGAWGEPGAVGCRRPAGLTVRVLVVDPQAFTPPYDHELCASLAARGHDVELADDALLPRRGAGAVGLPAARGVRPARGRLVLRWPSSPLRVPLKLAGHAARAGVAGARGAARSGRTSCTGSGRRCRSSTCARCAGSTGTPGRRCSRRTTCCRAGAPARSSCGGRCTARCDRVIVHSERGRERLEREVGVDSGADRGRAARAVRARWPVGRRAAGDGPPTILHFGLLRPTRGSTRWWRRCRRWPQRCPTCGSRWSARRGCRSAR